jgi:SAM-dependent methyltransferase
MNKKLPSSNDKKPMADSVDVHFLYEKSVQNVVHEIDFMRKIYLEKRGKNAKIYREDFCGTANSSCEWVKQGNDYFAIAVDNDKSVLEWALINRLNELSDHQKKRINLVEADVNNAKTEKSDILAAYNFSYFVFKERKELINYFEKSFHALKKDGIFFLDLFGGPEAHQELEEETEHDDFTYIWSQSSFHPLTNHINCHISFDFPDGSSRKNVFSYDWRLWTAPEIKEILLEIGFKQVTFYWEQEDDEGNGNGEFLPNEKGEADLAWLAYIVAEK